MTFYLKRHKGQITILLSLIAAVGGVLGAWITANGVAGDKIQDTRTEMKEEISKDRERIAILEEAIKTIKQDNVEIKSDIKIILQKLR